MVLQRHGTSVGGWTKHTTFNRQQVTAIDKVILTLGFIHQTMNNVFD